jgi:hypothetical protein
MREVPVPRGAQQRLLAQISELEAAEAAETGAGTGQRLGAGEIAAAEPSVSALSDGPLSRDGRPTSSAKVLGKPSISRVSRRRFLRGLVPVAACAVAMLGFFGVVWLFTPRWTVDDISKSLAEIDFQTLGALGDFTGKDTLALPKESGWDRLKWEGVPPAKGLPVAADLIAVYGFVVPPTRHNGPVNGLIAVIPKRLVRNPPPAGSLAAASLTSGYLQARIGESVSVAWQQGDFVCVCLIQGGPDSLSTLQAMLQQPSA